MPRRALESWKEQSTIIHPAVRAAAELARLSPLPTLVIDGPLSDHRVVTANDAIAALGDIPPEILVGQPVTSLIGTDAHCLQASLFRSALAKGCGGKWQIMTGFGPQPRVAATVYLTPLCDAGSRVVGHNVNLVFPAIAPAAILPGSAIEEGIFDNAPGFVAVLRGPEHILAYANTAYSHFFKQNRLTGFRIVQALPETVDCAVLVVLDNVYRTGIPFQGTDASITIRDAATGQLQQRWITVTCQPLRDDTGTITGVICQGHDVTAPHLMGDVVEELEHKIVHLSRVNAMGTMATQLAHELNQPLTAIGNYLAGVSPLEARKPDESQLSEALDGIAAASTRASTLIKHLRHLTRDRKPNLARFELNEAVAECIQLLKGSCEHTITIDNRVLSEITVVADRVQIQQVLINLLQNACEAMMDSGGTRIVVDAHSIEDGVTLSVSDSGTGIASQAIDDPFFWGASSKDDGMGVGLSICRTIVETHGGTIWLEKTGPEGSEFRLHLPKV
ncbi:ATP-binding protein [Erythrobacter sp. R86502]|uniref:PAS domain-containing sensor histidine kinase n=1 Tax=Erythrobacter sp. R86502 TaxID=3093846 RepID=UPI0036D349A4